MAVQLQFPLKDIEQDDEKTAEYWFDHYSVSINKVGENAIPLLNQDAVQKYELVRFRGIISNQLNNEYFHKLCQFRELDDIKEPEPNETDHVAVNTSSKCGDIMQRFPMLIESEPHQTDWSKAATMKHDKDNDQAPQSAMNKVVAKFYCHTKTLKICDCIQVFGIWLPPKHDSNEAESKQNDEKDLYSSLSSPLHGYDKLPKIHVLYWKKAEYANPLMSALLNSHQNDKEAAFKFYHENASSIRSSLIEYIASNYTAKDYLLAEYILLNMISRVVSNNNGILLGHFPLNIRGQFNNYKIRELYELLCPHALNIVLTINYLNAKRFVPVKNNETDELECGILQFRNDTAIVVDETLLQQGTLQQTGLQNIEALSTLIHEQKVLYDFEFHTIPFDVSSSVIVLSKSKPLPQLRTHCFVYAEGENQENESGAEQHDKSKQVEQEQEPEVGGDADDEEERFTLDEYRTYLSICSEKLNDFALNSKEVCKAIEEDFVEIRKEDSEANQDTLHHRLLVMRLVNSSFLNQTSDEDMMNVFRYMQLLEKKRKVRNEKFMKDSLAPIPEEE